MNIYKEDLQEFTRSIKEDTVDVLAKASVNEKSDSSLPSQITAGISNLLNFMDEPANREYDDDDMYVY